MSEPGASGRKSRTLVIPVFSALVAVRCVRMKLRARRSVPATIIWAVVVFVVGSYPVPHGQCRTISDPICPELTAAHPACHRGSTRKLKQISAGRLGAVLAFPENVSRIAERPTRRVHGNIGIAKIIDDVAPLRPSSLGRVGIEMVVVGDGIHAEIGRRLNDFFGRAGLDHNNRAVAEPLASKYSMRRSYALPAVNAKVALSLAAA